MVGFFGLAITGSKGVVFTEYCEGRDLFSALDVLEQGSGERIFSWRRKGRRVALELARALNYLHRRNVIHMVSAWGHRCKWKLAGGSWTLRLHASSPSAIQLGLLNPA